MNPHSLVSKKLVLIRDNLFINMRKISMLSLSSN